LCPWKRPWGSPHTLRDRAETWRLRASTHHERSNMFAVSRYQSPARFIAAVRAPGTLSLPKLFLDSPSGDFFKTERTNTDSAAANRHRNHDKCPRIGYISAGQLTALKENPGSGILQFSSTPEPVLRLRQTKILKFFTPPCSSPLFFLPTSPPPVRVGFVNHSLWEGMSELNCRKLVD